VAAAVTIAAANMDQGQGRPRRRFGAPHAPAFVVVPQLRSPGFTWLTRNSADQGQGGAQGVEDGVALGIALCGATPEKIADRLKVYEKTRRGRASAIQVLSNAGQDQVEEVFQEAAQYIDPVPSTLSMFDRSTNAVTNGPPQRTPRSSISTISGTTSCRAASTA
jgi:hypothetical protein